MVNRDLVETLNAKHQILNNIQTEMLERAKGSDTD